MTNILIANGMLDGVVVFVAALFWCMPRLTRRDLYFAVTVPPDFRDSMRARAILGRYRIEVTLVSLLALAGVAALPELPAIPLLQIAAFFAVFVRARQRVLPYAVAPGTIREVDLRRRRGIPGGWVAASGPFGVLAATVIYLNLHWQKIPARFPIHWNGAMQPDGWADHTLWGVYAPLLIAVLLCALMTVFLYGLAHWTRAVHVGGDAGAREALFRLVTSLLLLAMEYFMAIQISWTVLQTIHHTQTMPGGAAAPLILLAVVLGAAGIMAWLGQGGGRRNGGETAAVGDRTPDDFWKLGVLYFNPDDPAVLVEKRFGLGYTLNFARPLAWIVLGLIAAAVLIPLALRLSKALQ